MGPPHCGEDSDYLSHVELRAKAHGRNWHAGPWVTVLIEDLEGLPVLTAEINSAFAEYPNRTMGQICRVEYNPAGFGQMCAKCPVILESDPGPEWEIDRDHSETTLTCRGIHRELLPLLLANRYGRWEILDPARPTLPHRRRR